jgi:hypothetical protein
MTIQEAINHLRKDFEMLQDGTWIPDEHSINDSLSTLDELEKLINKPVETINEQPKCDICLFW